MPDLKLESSLADKLESGRGRHWTRIIPFPARVTRAPSADEHPKDGWQLRHTAAGPGHGTNLEAAVRDGVAAMPAGMVPRLVLASDGNENLGSVARGIWQAQQLGIPIDTVPLAGHAKPGLLLESVGFPGQVFSGEHFPVEVTLESPKAATASVEMTAEGKAIGTSTVPLQAGTNHLRLQATVNSVGAIALAGKISAGDLGEARFEDAVTLRHPRVLLVSHDPPESETHLIRTFESNQFEVERAPNGVPDKLDDYQLIVMNNWDMESIPLARKEALEEFEKAGGGLLWIAGEHNVYVEKKDQPEDALERSLPAKLAPPRSPEGTAVVLIIDKSSSMEGRKIELARLAAIGRGGGNLRPIDSVGVLIFDNSFQWAVNLRKADDRPAIKRLIAGITPDGGTQIAPGADRSIHEDSGAVGQLTNISCCWTGCSISEEGGQHALSLTKEAVADHVTISTVGLGQDVNRAFLEKVAESALGKSYFLNDPSGLEQILLRDVEEHTGSTAVEKPIMAKVLETVAGFGWRGHRDRARAEGLRSLPGAAHRRQCRRGR